MTEGSDEAVERVLAGLREVEAPAGMERRVLEALGERALVQAPLGWRRFRPLWLMTPMRPVVMRSVACGSALAGLVVVGMVIHSLSVVRRSGHASGNGYGHGAAQSQMGSASAARLAPATSEVAGRGVQLVPHEPRVANVEAMRRSDAGATNAQIGEVGRDVNSAELRRMLAVSYPAPPMPLTEQERLLLRIAHGSDPVELAVLEPMLRPVQDAEEKREFQRFFGQSTKQAATEQAGLPATGQVAPELSTPEQGAAGQMTTEQVPEQLAIEQQRSKQLTTGDDK
jgi:hypothetical protein